MSEVAKVTKVVSNGHGVYFCDNCSGSVWQIRSESKYCFRCGCKLDWSTLIDEETAQDLNTAK